MQTTIILWAISVLSMASSTIVFMDNETHDLIQFAHDIAIINKIDPVKFVKLINCESNFKYAYGDYRSETEKYMAHGPAQWWRASWDNYAKKFDMEYLDYKDSKDQLILAAKVIAEDKKGIDNWWTCKNKVW